MKMICILLPLFAAGIGFNKILDRLDKAMKVHEGVHHANDGWHDYEEYEGVVYKRSTEYVHALNKKA